MTAAVTKVVVPPQKGGHHGHQGRHLYLLINGGLDAPPLKKNGKGRLVRWKSSRCFRVIIEISAEEEVYNKEGRNNRDGEWEIERLTDINVVDFEPSEEQHNGVPCRNIIQLPLYLNCLPTYLP